MMSTATKIMAIAIMVLHSHAQTCPDMATDLTSPPLSMTNPDLPDTSCEMGLNVVLVLDASNSINPGAEQNGVKAGATAVARGLLDTHSNLAIVEFSATSLLRTGYAPVDSFNIDMFLNTINTYPTLSGTFFTNWEAAFKVVNDLNMNSNDANLIVFLTDGNPTTHNLVSGGLSFNVNEADDRISLNHAINQANCVKQRNGHILALGVGSASEINQANLELIAGAEVSNFDMGDPFDLKSTDVLVTSDFDSLEAVLSMAIGQVCPSLEPSLSVEPSRLPSSSPSLSMVPSVSPSAAPSVSIDPSSIPSNVPSSSIDPSSIPSNAPSVSIDPSVTPSAAPSASVYPSTKPSYAPSTSIHPSSSPSLLPSTSRAPSEQPSIITPSPSASTDPSSLPTSMPSILSMSYSMSFSMTFNRGESAASAKGSSKNRQLRHTRKERW